MFTAALFAIAKAWKQPECPSTDGWIKKMWCTHTMEYYSAIKKNEIMLHAATWMDEEIIILSTVNQKKKYHIKLLTWNLNYDTNEPVKQKQSQRHRKQICGCQGRGGYRGEMDREFGISICQLLHIG